MADMRVNRAKAKLQAGKAAVCFAAWGYGGADALERLYAAKGRPRDKPFAMLVADAAAARSLVGEELPPLAEKLMRRYWPGPLTVVVPSRDGAGVGLRMPSSALALELLKAADVPVIALMSLDETEVMLGTARGGAVDYLVKANLDPRQLSRAIRYAVERTSILAARRRAEASLREVVTSSADAMVVVDADGNPLTTEPDWTKFIYQDWMN